MKLEDMSREKLIDLASEFGIEVKGTGKNGFIKAADLVSALRTAGYEDEPEPEVASEPEAKPEVKAAPKVAAKVEKPAEPVISAEDFAKMQAMVDHLTLALAAAQRQSVMSLQAAEKSVDAKLYELRLSIPTHNYNGFYHDHRGDVKRFRLTNENPVVLLTAEQIAEVKEISEKAFKSGRLTAPAILPENSNHVHSLEAFSEGLTIDNIEQKVGKVDSLPSLWMLYAELENRSVQTQNDKGEPLKNSDGKPYAVQVRLPAILTLLKSAVQARIAALTPVSSKTETGALGGVAFTSGAVD